MLFLLIIAGILLLAGVRFAVAPSVPSFKGKSLDHWLEDLATARTVAEKEEAIQAIRTMGADALPHIVKLSRARDPRLLTQWNEAVEKIHLDWFKRETAWQKRNRATLGLSALGPLSEPFVHESVQILTSNVAIPLVHQAMWDLRNIGAAALPTLVLVKHPLAAETARGIIEFEADYATPTLLALSQNQNAKQRLPATTHLSWTLQLLLNSCCRSSEVETKGASQFVDPVVRGLVDRTNDSDPAVRRLAHEALGSFEVGVRSALQTNGIEAFCMPVFTNALRAIENSRLAVRPPQ